MKGLMIIGLALSMSACTGWYGNQEESYMQACEETLGKQMHSENKKTITAICTCSLDKVKEKWSHDEFTQKAGSSEMKDIMDKCIEKHTAAD